jgi:hypothetical protein
VDKARTFDFSDGKVRFQEASVNAYLASVVADFIRQKLLDQRASFVIQTALTFLTIPTEARSGWWKSPTAG